ncbi:type II secretion system F family protein [Tessaracoccus oleiagri]|uniref:Tight adherence protein B n=1 Tax=Tessaracoccus oleiagri TaxID=686624 RepID=A0A1G9N055_9ACTN|nr:type II secretion system F family protein [Tessaracoccus oleiagri]SDL79517.1 tight adherence protein B [Tessaracoccus oleiagri]
MLTPLLAGAAAWLVVPGPGRASLARLSVVPTTRRSRSLRLAPVAAVALGAGSVVLVLLGPSGLGWAVTAAILAGLLTWFVTDRARRAAARRRGRSVAAAARLLASLLWSGQIPVHALREAAAEHGVLREAAATAALGGDVPAVLRAREHEPGGHGLGMIAAAWRVSERSGAPVAGVLEGVAETLREEQRVSGIVETELATARASGQIMAVLPVGAVGLGFLGGTNSLEFLFGHPVGQWLCAVAMGLTAAGTLWIERLARR